MNNKINEKYLEEARQCKIDFSSFLDMEYFSRNKNAVLLESVRLRNEFNGTDEEYKVYLEDFNKRYKAV
jgi:hypothetical protein